jgi:hypothetical protein
MDHLSWPAFELMASVKITLLAASTYLQSEITLRVNDY